MTGVLVDPYCAFAQPNWPIPRRFDALANVWTTGFNPRCSQARASSMSWRSPLTLVAAQPRPMAWWEQTSRWTEPSILRGMRI